MDRIKTISQPEYIEDSEQLEEVMSRPTPEVIETIKGMTGDLLILGVGGKMGADTGKTGKTRHRRIRFRQESYWRIPLLSTRLTDRSESSRHRRPLYVIY